MFFAAARCVLSRRHPRQRGVESSALASPPDAVGEPVGVHGRARHALHPCHLRRRPSAPSSRRYQLHEHPHGCRAGPDWLPRLPLAPHQHRCSSVLDCLRPCSLPHHTRRSPQPWPCSHPLLLLLVSRNHCSHNLFWLSNGECPAHRCWVLARRRRRFCWICRGFCRRHPCLCPLVTRPLLRRPRL